MGVIHGLSINQGKLDVQLDDQTFGKDGQNKVSIKAGGGIKTDATKGLVLNVGTGLNVDEMGVVSVRADIVTGGTAAEEVKKLQASMNEVNTNIQLLQDETEDLQSIRDNAAQMNKDLTALQNVVNDYHKPFGINLGASPTLLEVGTGTSNVTITWSYQHADVHVIASQKLNSAPVAVGTLKSVQSVPLTAHATKTFTLEASTTKGKTLTKSVNVVINHASYYGVVDAAKTTLSAAEIKALTKKLSTGKALGATSFAQNNQKVVYAYPEYFGALVSVKNSSGFEGLSGYEKKTVAVDGQNYNLYISKDAATSTDKLTFA